MNYLFHIYTYPYMYIYMYVCVCVCIYIYEQSILNIFSFYSLISFKGINLSKLKTKRNQHN